MEINNAISLAHPVKFTYYQNQYYAKTFPTLISIIIFFQRKKIRLVSVKWNSIYAEMIRK